MTKTAKTPPVSEWIARVGLDYRTPNGDVRVEAGEACVDLPEGAVKWLKAQGLIEPARKAKSSAGEASVEVTA